MASSGSSRFASSQLFARTRLARAIPEEYRGTMGRLALNGMERRVEPREAVRQPVRVYYGEKLGLWADCELRDLSASGAKVHLSSIYKLPPRFILLLHQTGVAYEVVLKWRRGDLAGLSFEERHDLETTQETHLVNIREAWIGLRPAQ